MIYLMKSRSAFCFSAFFILVFLLSAFSYLRSYEEQLLHGDPNYPETNSDRSESSLEKYGLNEMETTDPQEPIAPSEVSLPENYESLFYLADMKPVIKEAIHGSPFNYLPEYRNPCWLAKIVGEAGVMPEIWRPAMDDFYRDRLNQGNNWRLRCFPLVHLVGFSKSGTSDLYRCLKQHPHIVHSRKEPLFWTLGRLERNRTLESYIAEHDHIAEQVLNSVSVENNKQVYTRIILDASSTKIYYMDTWREIPGHRDLDEPKYTVAMTLRALTPQAKIIIIMRNPTDRTYSRFRMFCSMCTPQQFHEFVSEFLEEMKFCLKYQTIRGCAYNYTLFSTKMPSGVEKHSMFIRASLYYVYVRDWLDVFPRDQVHIVHAEEYYKDRVGFTEDMFHFLDLDLDLISSETWDHIRNKAISNNSDQQGRMPESMLNATRTMLNNFFRPYNEMLAKLLKDDRFRWKS